jgi:hypothetical protein
MKTVYICSPLKGDIARNIINAQKYSQMAVDQGYCPMTPHAFFPLFMDDTNPEERAKGIACGMEMLNRSDIMWQFGEPSEGMKAEIKWWNENKKTPIIYFKPIKKEESYDEREDY